MSKDVMNELQELCKRYAADEITKAQAEEKANDILMKARASMTDEDFLEVQREILARGLTPGEVLHLYFTQWFPITGFFLPNAREIAADPL
jgi:hypothetical protein